MDLSENITQRLFNYYSREKGRYPPGSFIAEVSVICHGIKYHRELDIALFNAFIELLERLPSSYFVSAEELRRISDIGEEYLASVPTVPLYDAFDDCGRAIYDFFARIMYDPEIRAFDLLPDIRRQLLNNENAMNGLSAYERRSTTVPEAYERDEPPDKLCWLHFHDTPFLKIFNIRIPFNISTDHTSSKPSKWASHARALGPSGAGKTQLLQCFCADFLKEDIGFFFLDPHGDAFHKLAQRVEPSRLVVLDPDDEYNLPSLNFLSYGNSTEPQILQTFSYLMSSLSGGMSEKGGALVPYLLKLLRKIPNASLETLRMIVDEKVKGAEKSAFWPAIQTLPTVDQGFFHTQWFHSSMEPTKAAIAWRLYAALASDAFRQMFGAKHNSLNFDRLIAERKVVVVKGGFDSLGEDGMRIFLQFLLAQYYAAGMRRLKLPENQRHLNLFICDEASKILTSPLVAQMLFDLRKVSCGFLGATQVWEQVATDVKAAVLGNTAIKIVGPVQHNDASVLSREMYCDIDFIRNMQRSDNQPFAPWAMYVNGMTKKAARVTVPFGVLERMPKINQNAISFTSAAAISTKTSEEEELEDILKSFKTINENADAMIAENQRILVKLKEIEQRQTQEGSGEPSHTKMPKQRGDTEASPSQPADASTGADLKWTPDFGPVA
jgi:hypothetical protein